MIRYMHPSFMSRKGSWRQDWEEKWVLRVRDNRYNYKHFRLTFIRNAYYFCFTYMCTVYIRYFLASKTNGFDCIVIPGASKTAGTDLAFDKQCGRSKGLITADGGSGKTVCSKYRQHILEFHFMNINTRNMEYI